MFSIVMPAYNEGEHIYENLLKTNEIVSSFCDDFEIICVNDGSSDNTEEQVKKASEKCPDIKLVTYPKNGGKGYAIKKGVEASKGDRIAFLDADLDLSPDHFEDFLSHMDSEKADVVIGSKMHKESKLEYPFLRKFISFGYYVMFRVLFRLKVHDTQTGIKVYKADILKEIVPGVITKGFAYDIELLACANEMGAKIIERPIRLVFTREGGFSRIRFKDIWQVFKDTFKIKRKIRKIRKERKNAASRKVL